MGQNPYQKLCYQLPAPLPKINIAFAYFQDHFGHIFAQPKGKELPGLQTKTGGKNDDHENENNEEIDVDSHQDNKTNANNSKKIEKEKIENKVRRLSDNAYKPWGSNSRPSSPNRDEGSPQTSPSHGQ